MTDHTRQKCKRNIIKVNVIYPRARLKDSPTPLPVALVPLPVFDVTTLAELAAPACTPS